MSKYKRILESEQVYLCVENLRSLSLTELVSSLIPNAL